MPYYAPVLLVIGVVCLSLCDSLVSFCVFLNRNILIQNLRGDPFMQIHTERKCQKKKEQILSDVQRKWEMSALKAKISEMMYMNLCDPEEFHKEVGDYLYELYKYVDKLDYVETEEMTLKPSI